MCRRVYCVLLIALVITLSACGGTPSLGEPPTQAPITQIPSQRVTTTPQPITIPSTPTVMPAIVPTATPTALTTSGSLNGAPTVSPTVTGLTASNPLTDTVIIDDSSGHLDQQSVRTAATALAERGAIVIVLVSTQTGTNPQTYAKQKLKEYGISIAPLDRRAIIYLIALDIRNVFIYYGADWQTVLDPAYKRIADDDMIPQLARGHLTTGTIAGIYGTIYTIKNKQNAR
jgi:hypothetical protein